MFTLKKIIIAIIVAASLGIAIFFFLDGKKGNNSSPEAGNKSLDRFFSVKKEDMIIGVSLTGTVNARKKHKLSCEAAFRTQLVSVVDENTKVKKGDTLVEFETDDLKQKIDDLKVELENKRKTLEITEEERAILVSSNNADIESAKNRVVEAEDAFNKYWKLEGPKAKDLQQLNVDAAEQKVEDAKADYNKFRDKFNQTIYSDEATETAAKAKLKSFNKGISTNSIALNNALLDQKIFKRYTHPNRITSLKNKLKEIKLNLKKVKIRTASLLVQKDNQIYNAKTRIKKNERDLKKHEEFLPQMRLVSPADGLVIYGDPDRRWGKLELKIGMDIRKKQTLLTIPDLSDLIVNFDIPEQYRSKVKLQDKVILTPESIPTLKIDGVVSEIASLPKNQIRWDPYSPKIYKSKIDITQKESQVVSGMNVRVAIVNKILKDRIVVPIEAVFDKSGQYFVYLKQGAQFKEVNVDIGESNDSFVEIKSGLKPGDVVYLYRPFQSSKNP
jgi:HlyD family secretion protein